ncbi:hypothetical protein SteCoe_16297 [Stentor coeruleus]|uniref:Uncharacterized protein n=1 Tax=Stentor coeruleus TaxID=5963 RepID=A0A1R2C1N9_9CILI|nr:hypothetical protein SteCoe_16297 [Stentor coeruleus]
MARSRTNETLNFQIDKLSEAIESMMKGFETLQTPRILDSDMIRVKPPNSMHVGLTGDEDISDPDSFCREPDDEIERPELHLDRLAMITEDFRSFESRKLENSYEDFAQSPCQVSKILELICERINDKYGISLPFSDLEDFISAFQGVVERQIDCSLVDLHSFILRICEMIQKEQPSCQKFSLGDTILNVHIKDRPRRRFQKPDYSVNYDQAIEKLLQDKDLPDEIKSIGRIRKNLLSTLNLEKIRKMEVDEIREDLEYQMADLELMKKKLLNQLESLSKFSKQLRQKDIELIKLRESLEDTETELKSQRQLLEDKEIKHFDKIKIIKSKINEVCPDITSSVELKPRSSIETSSTGRLSPLVIQVRTSTPVLPMRSSDMTSDELTALQNELAMLEAGPQDSNTLLRITRVKTQISTIRSATAINNSLRNSTSSLSKINDHKRNTSNCSSGDYNVSPSPLPRSGCSSPIGPDNLYNSQILLRRTAPRPPAPGPRKAPQKVKEKETPDDIEIVRNQLRLQESRLKEREELIDEKENRLQRTWMRLPNSEELISMVQKELNYLGLIKKDYEDKYEDLNAELVTFAKKTSQLKAKERELENKMIELGKEKKQIDDDKRIYEQKYEVIMNVLESL